MQVNCSGGRRLLAWREDAGDGLQKQLGIEWIDGFGSIRQRCLSNSKQCQDRSRAVFPERLSDLLFVTPRNGVAHDDQVIRRRAAQLQRSGEVRGGDHFVPGSFQQHLPCSQQRSVVRDRQDAGHGLRQLWVGLDYTAGVKESKVVSSPWAEIASASVGANTYSRGPRSAQSAVPPVLLWAVRKWCSAPRRPRRASKLPAAMDNRCSGKDAEHRGASSETETGLRPRPGTKGPS